MTQTKNFWNPVDYNSSNRNKNQIKQYDEDDIDDILKKLDEDNQEDSKRTAVNLNQESEKFYRMESKSNRKETRNKYELKGKLGTTSFNHQESFKTEQITKALNELKNKYNSFLQLNQDGIFNQYRGRNGFIRPVEHFSEIEPKSGKIVLLTKIKGVPSDGRLVTESTFRQDQVEFGNYTKMYFEKGKAIIIISASVDNTYVLFGFKETNQTLAKKTDVVQVFAIESTNVKPKFEICPPGIRTYRLSDWNEIGSEFSIVGHNGIVSMSSQFMS